MGGEDRTQHATNRRRRWPRILIAVAGLFLVALVSVYVFRDRLMHAAVEAKISALLGAPVRIGSLEAEPFGDRAVFQDITIEQPAGFPESTAVSSPSVTVIYEPRTLLEERIVVRTARVIAPQVTCVATEDRLSFFRLLGTYDGLADCSVASGMLLPVSLAHAEAEDAELRVRFADDRRVTVRCQTLTWDSDTEIGRAHVNSSHYS